MRAGQIECRACHGSCGDVVLDLGEQPASDYFPPCDQPGPDPVYPLQMWLCSSCGLAQLVGDATTPEKPSGHEPAALVAQATDAIERVAASGLFGVGSSVAECPSPHGGSWLGLLEARGLTAAEGTGPVDVVVDCFGLMHEADQSAALAERLARLDTGGVLLLQYHSLEAIVRQGQWHALRHGHYAYYSTTALDRMLRKEGFSPRTAWRFDLYGGTVLLAARRDADDGGSADESVQVLLALDARSGVRDPSALRGLQDHAETWAARLRQWLVSAREVGGGVIGYGAASRAVTLLAQAAVDRSLLPAVVDASPAKHGLRMPGTDVPVVSPSELRENPGRTVLVFVPELLAEVRTSFPEVGASGGRWVDAEALGT